MSAVESFGNLVNSLRSVRDDYHEHLRTVPQYGAYLLVESSTATVAGALHPIVNSSTPSMAAEVIDALELARTKFQQHLTSVPEYRALLAIDKLITEVATDLSVKAETPVEAPTPATAEETIVVTSPIETTAEAATTQTTEIETQTAVAQEAAQEAIVEDAVATAETTEPQAPEQLTDAVAQTSDLPLQAVDETPAATADTEVLTADAISRIETALRDAETTETETPDETAPVAHTATDTTHDTTASHPDAEAVPSQTEPGPFGEERAA